MVREPIPKYLYKYLRPDQLFVLTSGAVRVSQRQVVDDPKDFQPECLSAAPTQLLMKHIGDQVVKDARVPEEHHEAFTRMLVDRFGPELLRMTREKLRAPDDIGMVCLTDDSRNEGMWNAYAAGNTGFVIELDVARFAGTGNPRLMMGRVAYSDSPLEFLSEAILSFRLFYQKGTRWAAQREWRGTHYLANFPVVGRDSNGFPIHVCSIPDGALRSIIIRPNCVVEPQLRLICATDARYRTVPIYLLA